MAWIQLTSQLLKINTFFFLSFSFGLGWFLAVLKTSNNLKYHWTLVVVIIPFLNTNSGRIWHVVALSPGLCRSRPADEGKGKKIGPITTREGTASSSHSLHLFSQFRRWSLGPLSGSSGSAACSLDRLPARGREPSRPCPWAFPPDKDNRSQKEKKNKP